MQLFATPTQPTHAPHRVAPPLCHKGARPWPFLAPSPNSAQDMVMAHARRIIATSKAHFGVR
jgi:hypothetical protein